MDSLTKPDPVDSPKIKADEQKLLANPEVIMLFDGPSTTATGANDLVRSLLRASITRELETEMDAYLGYAKGIAGGDNQRNESYVKIMIRTTAQSMSPSYTISRVLS